MQKTTVLYWRALRGFHSEAGMGLLFTGLSGLLEGTALMVLAPILGHGIALAREQGVSVYAYLYDLLHVPKAHRLTYTFLAFIAIGILSALVRFLADAWMTRLHARIEQSYRKRMGDALFGMAWPAYLEMRLGDIGKSIFMEGLRAGDGCFGFVQMMGQILITGVLLAISFYISAPLTLITFAFGALASLAYLWAGQRASNHAEILARSATRIGERISEIFNNLKFVRASGHTRGAQEETTHLYAQYAESYFKSLAYKSLMRFFFEGSGIVLLAGFLAYGFFWSGKPLEWTVVFLAVFYRLIPRLQLIQDNFYIARIHAPWVVDWHKRFEHISQRLDRPQGLRSICAEKHVRLEQVTYQYPQGSVAAVHQLSLTISKGKCLALVGESGSGKSTVIDLIMGLLPPTSGRVFIDDVPLEEVDLEAWRSQIGLVLQGAPLFYGTVLQNISWGEAHPDRDKAIVCAQMAQAWEFIGRLPKGIDTEVEEKGGRLSGGQRQRIALARALYRNPWLLVLDEPTSELDAESEERIVKALQLLKGRYAMLLTSHRLRMARLADEILVFENGQVHERGRWDDLSGKPGGLFQNWAKQQSLA